ncbi:hypothetical protein [Larkinella soli]|uniref:hypothetical protein n=1 Tax=Larkinella soli TaxID=1770527 RepID=UPI000FFB8F34|nr:hypothetical protein [Larkinella soli]
MTPEIRDEHLTTLEHYLAAIATTEFAQIQNRNEFSAQETDTVFPAMRMLLEYGHNKFGSRQGQVNYAFMHDILRDDFDQARDIARRQSELLSYLIGCYRNDKTEEVCHRLFSKRIAEMTGYEFQEYLKQIGVI